MAFHLAVGVLLQALGIFRYSFVLGINVLVALAVLVKTDFKQLSENLKSINLRKLDWVLLFIVVVLFIQLYSVHYDYTGKITTINTNYRDAKNMKYPYPYFSDEWSAVALIRYSIDSGKLPLVNPFWHNSPFPNFELPFHSFVSEIILFLNLNPLTHYTLLSLFSGLLICLLVYFILRINKINKFASAVACLSVPYIINSANLPGIWNLIPLILGLISFLLGILFMSVNDKKMIFFSAFLTLIFYPPLFVLHSISLIVYFIFADISKKEKIKSVLLYLIICALVTLVLFIFAFFVVGSLSNALHYAQINIFYETFTKDSIPYFAIWKVIPIPILLLAILGVFKLIRNKRKLWLIAPIISGLIFWIIYSRVLWVFIIGYARIVVSTSILITLLSGFGLHYLMKYINKIKKPHFFNRYKILEIIQIAVLVGFFILSFSYTQTTRWHDLKLYSVKNDGVFYPAAPAGVYLHEDDLRLFQDIKEKNFLSFPWKGTVIGAATGNYPLDTKPATVTNKIISLSDFMNWNCNKKIAIAKNYEIDYIYSLKFDCEDFKLKGFSREGLHLYEVLR